MPKTDFEAQVIREMRLVLRDNAEFMIEKLGTEDLISWAKFEEVYEQLQNFDYPHKDKLLEFIKYFFLDHILDADTLIVNYLAFKDTLLARRPPNASDEKSRNEGPTKIRSRKRSEDSQGSNSASLEDH